MLILNRQQLQRTLREYLDFYNRQRPHQGLQQRVLISIDSASRLMPDPDGGRILSAPILGGLHYTYSSVSSLQQLSQ
jgi:hypothetical protein